MLFDDEGLTRGLAYLASQVPRAGVCLEFSLTACSPMQPEIGQRPSGRVVQVIDRSDDGLRPPAEGRGRFQAYLD